MATAIDIATVTADNLAERGFFCRKSKMKTEGNQRKVRWATSEFNHGLGFEIVYDNGRSVGFVEYTAGEYTWRAVHAPGYLLIHCLWVVGRAKGKGYGRALLDRAEAKARDLGMGGVAMVTGDGVWIAGNELLATCGYEQVEEAPPSFQLMVKPFNGSPMPAFPTDWEQRAAAFGDGLTIVSTDQCPYLRDAEHQVIAAAESRGVPVATVTLSSAREVQERSPSAFGIFGIVLDQRLLRYHYMLEKDLIAVLTDRT